MRIRSASIISNNRKREAVKLKKDVGKFLAEHGIEVAEGGDILITIGGDGTLLYGKEKYPQPVFGIGNEKSFICQCTFKNWRKVLSRVLRKCRIEWRSMLQPRVSGRVYEDALNEICIKSRNHIVISILLSFLGRKKFFKADGIILSTPTGSTAYAYSAGGPELPRKARKYEIVAVAPYRREFKPAVVPNSTECEVRVVEGDAELVIDGQFIHSIPPNSAIKVRLSKRRLGLLQPA